jgi:hypothetical protein
MQYTIFMEINKLIVFTDVVKNRLASRSIFNETLADLVFTRVYFNVAEVPTGCAADACIS